MDQKPINNYESPGIDFQKAVAGIFRRMWLIALVSVLCAAISFAVTYFFVTPKYESSALFYVNNNSFSIGDASLSIDSGDISASKSLVDSYIVILNSRESLNGVIEHAGVDRTYREIKEMITAAAVNGTEIFEVVVTSPDPEEAEKIANAIAQVLPNRIAGIIEGTSAKIVDSAIAASTPSSPSYPVNIIVGFLIGMVLSIGIILLQEMFDITIRNDEEIAEVCAHPVLASVPDMNGSSRGGYYHAYGDREKKKKSVASEEKPLIGGGISFEASEAYNLLRTMLAYSFADEKNCRVIGITSAMTGEGKSLTAVNLALNLGKMRNNVLLIDCDMRRPSIAAKLGLRKTPGLSGYLSGLKEIHELVCSCGIKGDENAFQVITSGTNPPNPAELLGSARMEKLLQALRESYDYIILDLPPISEVSDALIVAKQTDGMLMVVRENYCSRTLLAESVQKLEFVGGRVLGIAYNCTHREGGRYGKGYYKRYYKHYYKRCSYSAADNLAFAGQAQNLSGMNQDERGNQL